VAENEPFPGSASAAAAVNNRRANAKWRYTRPKEVQEVITLECVHLKEVSFLAGPKLINSESTTITTSTILRQTFAERALFKSKFDFCDGN